MSSDVKALYVLPLDIVRTLTVTTPSPSPLSAAGGGPLLPPIGIAVLGTTGSGKTSFINIASDSHLRVGGGLTSYTAEVELSKEFIVDERRVVLMDTPGFDNTNTSDSDIWRKITAFLATTYEKGYKLTGIIYVHRISNVRFTGASTRNLRMIRQLCGQSTLKNVIFVTNMWGTLEKHVEERHEKEFVEVALKSALDKGAQHARHYNTIQSAHEIIRGVIKDVPTPIQVHRQIESTSEELNEAIARHKAEMEEPLGEMPIAVKMPSDANFPPPPPLSTAGGRPLPPIGIAVLGTTGSGKTSFINIASDSHLRVGDGIVSCTAEIELSKEFIVDGRRVVLMDTPSFDDTNICDAQMLRRVVAFLVETYEKGSKLGGIIYIHPISSVRFTGASPRTFRIFRQLCGESAMKNVIFVTNMWGTLDEHVEERHEEELVSTDFKPALDRGAQSARHYNTTHSAHEIIRRIIENDPLPLLEPVDEPPPTIGIAIMGATASGKSSFINIASDSHLRIGDDVISHTAEIELSKEFIIGGKRVLLMDTPGFDGTSVSDTEILRRIAGFLVETYEEGSKLGGIIYVHRVSDIRFTGASTRNLRMFRKLCGESAMKNIIFVTNMWGMLEKHIEERHEKEFIEVALKSALEKGAQLARHHNTTGSAHEIIRRIVENDPPPLVIEQGLVDERKLIRNTSASVNGRLNEVLRHHNAEMEELREDMRKMLVEKEKESAKEKEEVAYEFQKQIEMMRAEEEELAYKFRREVEMMRVEKERMAAKYEGEMEMMRAEKERMAAKYEEEMEEMEDMIRKMR